MTRPRSSIEAAKIDLSLKYIISTTVATKMYDFSPAQLVWGEAQTCTLCQIKWDNIGTKFVLCGYNFESTEYPISIDVQVYGFDKTMD